MYHKVMKYIMTSAVIGHFALGTANFIAEIKIIFVWCITRDVCNLPPQDICRSID